MTDQLKQAESDARDPALRVVTELTTKGRPLAVFREAGVIVTVPRDYVYCDRYIDEYPAHFIAVYEPGVPIEWVREDLA